MDSAEKDIEMLDSDKVEDEIDDDTKRENALKQLDIAIREYNIGETIYKELNEKALCASKELEVANTVDDFENSLSKMLEHHNNLAFNHYNYARDVLLNKILLERSNTLSNTTEDFLTTVSLEVIITHYFTHSFYFIMDIIYFVYIG